MALPYIYPAQIFKRTDYLLLPLLLKPRQTTPKPTSPYGATIA